MYRGVTGEILIAQSVGLWTVIEVSSSTIWYLHMKLMLHSTLRILHFICREAVWAYAVSEAYFIILRSCCQTALLAWRLVSFHTENRKWQDGAQRGGTTYLTTGGRDCNWRNVNVSIFTFTEAPRREGSIWGLGYYTHIWRADKVQNPGSDKMLQKVIRQFNVQLNTSINNTVE